MIELIPSIALCAWVLEERHAYNQTVLDVAVASENLDFITLPRVDRIVASWWKREDHFVSISPWNINYLLLPNVRRLLERAFFICFLLLYCSVVLLHRPIHSTLHPLEIFMYVIGAGYVLSKRQLFTSLFSGWNKTNSKSSTVAGSESAGSDEDSHGGDASAEGNLHSSWRFIDTIFCIALINMFLLRIPPWGHTILQPPMVSFAAEDVLNTTTMADSIPPLPDMLPLTRTVSASISSPSVLAATATSLFTSATSSLPGPTALTVAAPLPSAHKHHSHNRNNNLLPANAVPHAHIAPAAESSHSGSSSSSDDPSLTDLINAINRGNWVDWLNDWYTVMLTMATMTLWLRSLELFSVHPNVGPLLISLRKMANDVFNYAMLVFVLFTGTLLAFSYIVIDEEYTVGPIAALQSINSVLLIVYLAAVGEFGNFLTNEVITSLPINRQIIATLLGCLFIFLAAVVFLNILIASMNNTYSEVKFKSEVEFR